MKPKTCPTCRQTKPPSEFYIRRSGGRRRPRSECKRCEYERWKDWRSDPRNRKKENAWSMRYYYQHHEALKAEHRAYHRKYYLRNRKRLYLKHRDYANTPRGREVKNEALRRYRARRQGALKQGSVLTANDWQHLLVKFGYRCAWCGVRFSDEIRPEQDHVVPVSKGGPHTLGNIVPACRSCNASWGNKEKPFRSGAALLGIQKGNQSRTPNRSRQRTNLGTREEIGTINL